MQKALIIQLFCREKRKIYDWHLISKSLKSYDNPDCSILHLKGSDNLGCRKFHLKGSVFYLILSETFTYFFSRLMNYS